MLAKCELCYSKKTVTDEDTGEIICRECGTVLGENTEVSRQPRAFSKEEFETRNHTGAGLSLTRHDMGLSTIISRFNRDAAGRELDTHMRNVMQRLRTWDSRTRMRTSRERNLVHASNELSKLKDKLGLHDSVMEKAAYIYRKAQAMKLVRGRTTVALAAAAVYAACREQLIQRTLKDVASASNVKVKDLSRCYRILLERLDLSPPLQDPAKLVSKIASRIGLDQKVTREAIAILDSVQNAGGTAGKDPMGLSGAILYLACLRHNERITQKEIAQATGVTEVTIRNRAKEVMTKYGDTL